MVDSHILSYFDLALSGELDDMNSELQGINSSLMNTYHKHTKEWQYDSPLFLGI